MIDAEALGALRSLTGECRYGTLDLKRKAPVQALESTQQHYSL